jgi:hypothetical protein
VHKFWTVLRHPFAQAAAASGDADAGVYLSRLRVLVAGGDGTIAWVLGIIHTLRLQPAPPVAIMPLGTGASVGVWVHRIGAWVGQAGGQQIRGIEQVAMHDGLRSLRDEES